MIYTAGFADLSKRVSCTAVLPVPLSFCAASSNLLSSTGLAMKVWVREQ